MTVDPATIGILLLVGLVILLVLGAPITMAIGIPALVAMVVLLGFDAGFATSAQQMFQGINSFALLAIPLFILAGAFMNHGGIAIRLINVARLFVGKAPVPLIQTHIIGNAIFGAVSGSGVAAAAATGASLSPVQRKAGYDPNFSAAANIASAPAGMLIPPSNTLIVFSLVGGVSVSSLFVAGYVPGLLWMFACILVALWYGLKHKELRESQNVTFSEALKTLWQGVPSLGLVVVAVGGILAGYFTPTEGAAVAVLYALGLSLAYRTVSLKKIPEILFEACRTASLVIFLIAIATVMSYVMTYARVPQMLAESLFGWTDSPVLTIGIMLVILLALGTVLDPTPAILIFAPIFMPIAVETGMDPLQFGIFMVATLCIGVISPPAAPVLFVGAQVGRVKLEDVVRSLLPFYGALFVLIIMLAFIPQLSLFLPGVFGLL